MPDGRTSLRALSNSRYLAAAWILLVFFRIGLALAPYRLIKRVLPFTQGETAPAWAQARTRWAIGVASRAAFGATCLPQAMATKALLSLQGYSSFIRVGVRKGEGGVIQAHAWVLSGDDIVIGDEGGGLDSFSPLIDLRGPG